MTAGARLLIIVGVQTAALIGLIVWREVLLATGALVILQTVPVDPRSLFQGDFVVLRFDINRVDVDRFGPREGFRVGDRIHVTLVPDSPAWAVGALDHEWPTTVPDGAVVMRGRIESLTDWCGPGDEVPCPRRAWITYGIENYFVPEGTGQALEELRGSSALQVKVAVSSFGTPAIAALIVNGEELSNEGVF